MVYREGEGKDMVEYIPYVIEPSLGVERSVLAVLCDAYDEEVVGQDKNGKDDVRVVMHFHPALAPFKAAILPLSKKEVLSVTIKPEAVDPEDVEMLQDLVVSAVNEALRQANDAMENSMNGVTGGLDLSSFGL